MSVQFATIRFMVGQLVMRLGLAIVPSGPSRNELGKVLRSWGRHVKTVA